MRYLLDTNVVSDLVRNPILGLNCTRLILRKFIDTRGQMNRRSNFRLLPGCSIALSLVCHPVALAAADIDKQQKALQVIMEAADRICATVPIEGTGEHVELSLDAKAKLSGAIGRVVDAGIEGAAKYRSEAYMNALQQDLATALKNSNDCKLTVFKTLIRWF